MQNHSGFVLHCLLKLKQSNSLHGLQDFKILQGQKKHDLEILTCGYKKKIMLNSFAHEIMKERLLLLKTLKHCIYPAYQCLNANSCSTGILTFVSRINFMLS